MYAQKRRAERIHPNSPLRPPVRGRRDSDDFHCVDGFSPCVRITTDLPSNRQTQKPSGKEFYFSLSIPCLLDSQNA